MSKEADTIMISAAPSTATRGRSSRPLPVDALANNVNVFIGQIDSVLQMIPAGVGEFRFTEFTVSAEVSANGSLSLIGSGVELGATGGLTFKFERK